MIYGRIQTAELKFEDHLLTQPVPTENEREAFIRLVSFHRVRRAAHKHRDGSAVASCASANTTAQKCAVKAR